VAIRLKPFDRAYQPGALILAEGSPADSLLIIKTGSAMVVKHGPHDQAVVLDVLGPGSVIGELALLDNQTRSASIEAVEFTTCVEIPRALVLEQVGKAGPLVSILLRVMALRLRLAVDQVAELRRHPSSATTSSDPESARHLARHLRELETQVLSWKDE
jgi:CRP-like cAMP-binding protein